MDGMTAPLWKLYVRSTSGMQSESEHAIAIRIPVVRITIDAVRSLNRMAMAIPGIVPCREFLHLIPFQY